MDEPLDLVRCRPTEVIIKSIGRLTMKRWALSAVLFFVMVSFGVVVINGCGILASRRRLSSRPPSSRKQKGNQMRKQFTKTLGLTALAFTFAWNAYANITVTQAAGDIISALGVAAAQTATTTCNIAGMIQTYTPPGADGGRLSAVNVIPCVLNTLSMDSGTTEKTFPNAVTVHGVALNVHLILNTAGVTIDGVAYQNEVKIWACSGTCSTAASYFALGYMAFSSDGAADTINKGVLALNSNAQTGAIDESQFIRWDIGSATSNKAIDDIDAECHGTTATNIRTYSYRRVSNDAQAATLSANGDGMAESWNWTSNEGVYGGGSSAVAGGTPTFIGRFSRVASTNDFTYTDGGGSSTATLLAYPSFLSIATMNSTDYLGTTCSAITSTGFPKVITGAGILATPMTSAMNGMAAHPSTI